MLNKSSAIVFPVFFFWDSKTAKLTETNSKLKVTIANNKYNKCNTKEFKARLQQRSPRGELAMEAERRHGGMRSRPSAQPSGGVRMVAA